MPVVMLATIRLPVYDVDGQPQGARVLLDSGSSVSFISEKLVKKLKLVRRTCNVGLDTVGSGPVQSVRACVEVRLGYTEFEVPLAVNCLILNRIVGILPANKVEVPGELVNFSGKLADPDWNNPSVVDMLLGADMYHSVAKGKNLHFGKMTLINTIFGYAVSGPLGERASSYALAISAHVAYQDQVLERFWELEEVPTFKEKCTNHNALFNIQYKNEEEKFAEEYFLSTSTSDSEGRWTTRLPFFGDVGKLGNSLRLAYIRLLNLEKKLEENPITYQKYRDFMQEFLSLNHMEIVPKNELTTDIGKSYYIPHHCVIKEESTTTKLRVVFDASAKTSTGVSLNDILAAGPKLQDDLFMILIRFRWHKIAVCGDVAKMYRQVCLDDAGKDYHRLLWRDHVKEEIVAYRMTRVIYGVKSAGYSSVKALQLTANGYLEREDQLDSGTKQLIAHSMNDFYVDDMLSGAKNKEEARHLISSICKCLQSGGFELRKMASSDPSLINELPEKLRENVDAFILGDFDHTIKTLGIIWFPLHDAFMFKVAHLDEDPIPVAKKKRKRKVMRKVKKLGISENLSDFPVSASVSTFSKRQILSDIAKIFDPLGLLSPAVVTLKICMQAIWKSGLDWDELLPESLTEPYLSWRNSLVLLRELSIPRQVLLSYEKDVVTELHVFCDASEKAYGACVYVCQIEGNIGSCRLLTSKCKVAPLKQLTIPKLELSAAYLGAKLLKSVRHALRNSVLALDFFAWSDSTTVLHWLGSLPGKWQTFVSNRVALIQEIVPFDKWRHVPTELNPADLASRGVPVRELITSDIWWNGPDFLRNVPHQFPAQPSDYDVSLVSTEEKKVVLSAQSTAENLIVETELDKRVSLLEIFHLEKWSNLRSLLNCVAICHRIVDCVMKRKPKFKQGDFVTSSERVLALQKLVLATQDEHYEMSKKVLNRGGQMAKSHCLGKLYPFIDDDTGVIRVGGRLQAITGVSDSVTYPAILPKNCELARLLAIKIHSETLHGGLQLCMGTLRRSFWVTSSRQLFKELIRNCVKCYRFNSKPNHALMGDLPKERIMPSRPFAFAGLDFAGPLFTKIKGGKEKVYLAIFVCFATKAAHIEVVSRMTSIACIAALHRFVARRGVPVRLHTDNGTNLRGARSEIATITGMLNPRSGKVASEAQNLGMEWVFIPPGSPNFGGLWEAAVKSAKLHLKKVVGKQVLTFEELVTLCCDVELMLNSRPLMAMTEDANDLEALTPFMLLTGSSGGKLPMLPHRALKAEVLEHIEPKRRWTHVLNMAADFWKRWQTEYVTSLQQRSKHCVEIPNLEVGDLVLVTHENLAPLEWPLGRILKVFPGNDGQVRSVLVKTQKGQYLRPAYKARKLPISFEKDRLPAIGPVEVEKVEEIVSDPKEEKRRSKRLARKRQDVGIASDY